MSGTTLDKGIQPLCNAVQQKSWSENEADPHIKVKSETADCSSGQARHWVVAEGSVLREVKPEPTDWRPNTRGTSTCSEKFHRQLRIKNNDEVDVNSVSVNRHTCVTCRKSFKYLWELTNHKTVHKNVSAFICVICEESFERSYDLTRHQRSHANVKTHTCISCGKTFRSSDGLTQHQKIHSKSFICITCGKSFKHRYQLNFHNKNHTTVRTFNCDICGKSYRHRCSLLKHEKIHLDVRPFKFGKSFEHSNEANIRTSIHTRVGLFTCVTCGKTYKYKGRLASHEIIHKKVKSYTCVTCGKSYKDKRRLAGHETIHMKSYTCVTCGKSYKHMGCLTRHKIINKHIESYICNMDHTYSMTPQIEGSSYYV